MLLMARLFITLKFMGCFSMFHAVMSILSLFHIEMTDESRHFFASFVNREKSLTVLLKVLEKIQIDEVMSPEELWEYMNTENQGKNRRRRSAKSKVKRLSMQLTEPNTPNETPSISRPMDEFPSIAEVSSQSSLEQEDVSCPCDSHEGKLLLDNVFPLSVEEIYDLLFTDCPWFQKFNDLLKNTGYLEKGTYQGLGDHYSALERTLRIECQSRTTQQGSEMIANNYDRDSLSSIEDPITDAQPTRLQTRTRARIREKTGLTSTVNATTITTPTDYGFYIRIIICLLTGLLFLNALILYRMKHLEMQPKFGEDVAQLLKKMTDHDKDHGQAVSLENLLETVNQLTNDLQTLKQQISRKQEL
ncbi:hypothetical protein Angca_001378 [Angiostrongylus cantonensis]|nr:hypothetical protein Angca_001378 [Angiostrongylus cantonensis]